MITHKRGSYFGYLVKASDADNLDADFTGANIYGSYFSLRRAVAVDNTDDYPPYSNDLLSVQEPIPVLMRIAG